MSAEDNPADDVQPTREDWDAATIARLEKELERLSELEQACKALVQDARGRSGGSVYMVRRAAWQRMTDALKGGTS